MLPESTPRLPVSDDVRASLAAGLPPAAEGALLAELRALALTLADGTALSRLDDHEVMALLQAAAPRLALGRTTPELRRLVPPPVEGPAPPPPPAAAPRAAPATAAPAPASDSTFGSDLDVAAQVAVLVAAAQSGIPFCEECERARQEATA